MKTILLVLWSATFAAAADAGGSVYRCTLGGKAQALIVIASDGKSETGQIAYDSSGAEGLALDGESRPDGFVWQEAEPPGSGNQVVPTGTFIGKFSAGGRSARGHWRSADGKRKLPFTLTRLAVIETLSSRNADAAIEYPRFDESKYWQLNQRLAADAQRDLADHERMLNELREDLKTAAAETLSRLSAHTSCEVESVESRMVSLLCSIWGYTGGAHGNTELEGRSYFIDGKGRARPLGLWQVLSKSPAAVRKMSDRLIEDLKQQEASFVVKGEIKTLAKELDEGEIPFTLLPAGVAFHFEPYTVGAFVEGSFRSLIPNRLLAPMFRRDGPLSNRAIRNHKPKLH
jgi:hypothetical protein